MKIQTVNQLISVFKDISTRHYQINGFGVGDNWENGTSEKMHPVLWINPTTAAMPSSDNGYKTFEIDFEVRVFDLVNKDESNENEVLSDCIDILKDIIAEFKGHPYYVNSQLNIIDDINFEAFTEEFDEEVSGWICEISLMTPVLTSFCGIPSAEITGFEFPGADCPDVNVLCPVFVEDVTGVYPIVVTTTGTTKEVSIVGSGLSDTFVVSGEYDNGTLTLTRNDDVDVVVTGFDTGGDNDYTTSATLSGNIITFDRTDTVGAYSVDLTTAINSAPDKFVQSGAYDEVNNKIVLTLNDASTVDIDTSAIGGGGDSIYTADGTLTGNRTVDLDGNDLNFQGNSGLNIDNTVVNNNKPLLSLSKGMGNSETRSIFIEGIQNGSTNNYWKIYQKGSSNFLNNNGIGFYRNNTATQGTEYGITGISAVNSALYIANYTDSAPRMQFFGGTTNVTGNGYLKFRNYSATTDNINIARSGKNFINPDSVGGFSDAGFIVMGDTYISTETISLQGQTAIKGNGTSTGSALSIYDNDTTPTKLWDFLDNGNISLGVDSVINQDSNVLQFSNINSIGGLKFNGTSNNGIGLNLANGSNDFDFVIAGSSNTIIGTGSLGLLVSGAWAMQVKQNREISIGTNFEPVAGYDLSVDKAYFDTEITVKSPAGIMQFNGYRSHNIDPSTATFPNDKDFGVHKNTSSGDVFLAFNDGGVIKKVQLT